MKFQSAYNYAIDQGISCPEPTLTQQHFANEVNINQIMERATKGAQIPLTSEQQAIFGDFSEIGSYQDMYNKVLDAQTEFQTLPAVVRDHFKNDPGKLMEFIADKNNKDEAIKLGLIEAEKPPHVGQTIQNKESEISVDPNKDSGKRAA